MARTRVALVAVLLLAGCSGASPTSSSSSSTASGSGASTASGATSGGGTTSSTTGSSSSGGTSGASSSSGSTGASSFTPSIFTPRTVFSSYDVFDDGGANLDRLSVYLLDFALTCTQIQNLGVDGGGAVLPPAYALASLSFDAAPVGPGSYPFFDNDGGTRAHGDVIWNFADGGSWASFASGGSAVLTRVGQNVDAVGSFSTGLIAVVQTPLADGGQQSDLVDGGPLSGSFDATFCQLAR